MSRPVPTSPEEAAQYAGELWDLHVKPGEEEGWTREQYIALVSRGSTLTWELIAIALP